MNQVVPVNITECHLSMNNHYHKATHNQPYTNDNCNYSPFTSADVHVNHNEISPIRVGQALQIQSPTLSSDESENHATEIRETNPYPSATFKTVEHHVEVSILTKFSACLFYTCLGTIMLLPFLFLVILATAVAWIFRMLFRIGKCSLTFLNHNELRWLFTKQPVIIRIDVNKGLKFDRFKEIVNRRIISAETRTGERRFPRFSQKISTFVSGYAWATDTTFSIDDHFFEISPMLTTETDVQVFLSNLSTHSFELDRPMWDFYMQTCFGDAEDALVILRIHPSICDGVSLVQMLCSALCDDQAPFPMQSRFTASNFIFSFFRAILTAPSVFLTKFVFDSPDFNMLHTPSKLQEANSNGTPQGKPQPPSRVYLQSTMNLKGITRTKQITRSTYNDIFCNLVSGGLRAYQQVKGVQNPFDCRVILPVHLSSKNMTVNFGSNYVLTDVSLPVNIEGTIPRLWKIKERMEQFKSSSHYLVQDYVNRMFSYFLPAHYAAKVSSNVLNKGSCFLTNLQGPDYFLWLDSKEVQKVCYWFPIGDNVRVSFGFFTYADQLNISITADRNLPDPEFLLQMVVRQIELFEKLLEFRRIPGESRSAMRARSAALTAQGQNSQPIRSTPHRPGSSVLLTGPNNVTEPTNPVEETKPVPPEPPANELRSYTYDELQMRLATVQLQLQDPDGVPIEQRDNLKSDFLLLMTELRRRKTSHGEVDFDEPGLDRVPRRKVSLASLRSLTSANSRRRSVTHGQAEQSESELKSSLTITTKRKLESWEYDV